MQCQTSHCYSQAHAKLDNAVYWWTCPVKAWNDSDQSAGFDNNNLSAKKSLSCKRRPVIFHKNDDVVKDYAALIFPISERISRCLIQSNEWRLYDNRKKSPWNILSQFLCYINPRRDWYVLTNSKVHIICLPKTMRSYGMFTLYAETSPKGGGGVGGPHPRTFENRGGRPPRFENEVAKIRYSSDF